MKNKNSKPVPWELIKAAYLNGVKNKDIAQEFNIPVKKLNAYISRHKWKQEKDDFSKKNVEKRIQKYENSTKISQEEINKITLKTVKFLETVIDNEGIRVNDKIQAAKVIVDISGLKTIKQDITEPITINFSRNYD